MTVDEVAIALGMSKQGVRKAIARGVMSASLAPGGRGGKLQADNSRMTYVVDDAEVERYRVASRKPRRVAKP